MFIKQNEENKELPQGDLLGSTVDEMETLNEDYAPEALDESYKPVNQLFIPDEAKTKYKELGFDLQWARIYVPDGQGQLDLKNIQKKESDFYEFVPRKDVIGLNKAMTSYFGEEILDGNHGLYIVGDLALVKFPKVRQMAKRRYLEDRTRLRSKAIIDDLRKNSLMPDEQSGEKIETVQQRPTARDVEFGN